MRECVRATRDRPRLPDETAAEASERMAASSFTGELVGASEDDVTLVADGGVIAIPYAEIRRSNLIEE